jgi:hypothetical protein
MAEERMEMWKEGVWRDVEKKVEDGDIAVIAVSVRTSESFYNYKTKYLYIVFKDLAASYEESLERNIDVANVSAGAFQPFSVQEIGEKMSEFRKRGYTVRRITL